MFDLTDYQVGDEFEGSPVELGQLISAILAESGSFDSAGKSITITSLPNRPKKAEEKIEIVEEKKSVKAQSVAEVAAPAADPVPTQEPSVTIKPTPPAPKKITDKPSGRPRKATNKTVDE